MFELRDKSGDKPIEPSIALLLPLGMWRCVVGELPSIMTQHYGKLISASPVHMNHLLGIPLHSTPCLAIHRDTASKFIFRVN